MLIMFSSFRMTVDLNCCSLVPDQTCQQWPAFLEELPVALQKVHLVLQQSGLHFSPGEWFEYAGTVE